MRFFTENTSLIIPTKDRSYQVIDLLKYLKFNKIKFFEILVIDSSNKKNCKILKSQSKKLNFKYFYTYPSTSYQRNLGLNKKNSSTRFVMFLDDDVIFFKNTFNEMNKTIKKYLLSEQIGGFGFNQVQKEVKINFFERIKNSKLIDFLGFYSIKPGKVLKSGWHTKILNVKKNVNVDWLYSTACIYKSNAICNFKFNENFGQYSYLEDLDFSLNLKKINKRIIISYLAKFQHPVNIDRSSFSFGIQEVINRFQIVKKYNFDIYFFFLLVFLRFLISFSGIFKLRLNSFLRSVGNIYGIILCIKN